jgi:hypothetical protein
MAPDAIIGLEFINQEKKISEMSAQEMVEEFKTQAFLVGSVTK